MSDGSNKNSAVSPVIGTILLVAITVVLVAIIGAVMMSLADAEDGKKVGMNAQPDNNETAKAKLILYGGESLSELIKLEMIDHDSPYGEYVLLWEGAAGTVSVGVPYPTLEDVARPPKDMKVYDTRINVKGTFVDGREVVLLVQPMTFYDVERSENAPPLPFVNTPKLTSEDTRTMTSMELYFTTGNVDGVAIGELYYQEKGNESSRKSVSAAISGNGDSPTFTAPQLDLMPETVYEVWGVINTPSGTYNSSPAVEYETKPVLVTKFERTTSWPTRMNLNYYLKEVPSGATARIYYQENGNESSRKSIDLPVPHSQNDEYTRYRVEVNSLYPPNAVSGTISYDAWGVIIYKGREYAETTPIDAMTAAVLLEVRNDETLIAGTTSITGEIISRSPEGVSIRLDYQIKGDPSTKKSLHTTEKLSETYPPNYNLYKFTLEGLDPNTEYELLQPPVIEYLGETFTGGKTNSIIVKTLSE